ncbi:hypothetical protein LC087_01920 [Bacillus carboniphilus]|uniref:Uncharacterized protein n=1 Tax=Bacillus carboniphilus TaxID=86663 RepID=A0ABY9JUF4_9BACI|nr:hypothetical protein [Bacillus carboniphilus]WLR43002.1 hypothetical protein LC087_01920 [Bacillus carboniphilus]
MKKSTILIIMLISSLSLLPSLGIKTIRRFLPSTIFISFIISMESTFAKKKNWWTIHEKLFPHLIAETPFILGPFLTGSLFILKKSYGNIFQYFFYNLFFDYLFIYPLYAIFNKLGIITLNRLRQIELLRLFLLKAMLMYFFQTFIEESRSVNE